jgi:serine phosphatase RsbU (regulator of sigma subunit)
LATAGGVFDRSLDPRQTMQAIAETAVPRLADMCVIDLVGEDARVGSTVAVAIQEDTARRLLELREIHPIDPSGEHPVARAIRARTAVVMHDLMDEHTLARIAPELPRRELLEWGGYRSVVVMPLTARGRLHGTLSLLYTHEVNRFDVEQIGLVRDLADRAAMALDNATQFAARTQLARTLQSSLMPQELPRPDGVTLASVYHPAGEGNEVGGDFYDAFTTPSGCWLVVGDVCGKGPEAAAVTALVRHSIRAFAFVRPSPAQVLGAVNEVMLGHELAFRFATVVLCRLELRSRPVTAVLASAGHPTPLLLGADGEVSRLGDAGKMLGVSPGTDVVDVEIAPARGSTLVLYTDGLLDAGAPEHELTIKSLSAQLTDMAGCTPERIVEELECIALSHGSGRLRDDMAILAARLG